MGNFYTDVLKNDIRFDSTTVIKDVDLLEPGTKAAVQKIIELAAGMGKTLKVTETYRSQARQTEVYNNGASKLKKVGCHGYGLAVDFALFEGKKYIQDGEQYKFLIDLCKEVGMISGIDWGAPDQKHTFIDSGHVQRIPLHRQTEVFNGEWYPPEDTIQEQQTKETVSQTSNTLTEEHWIKEYWRPACAWIYLLLCVCDFLVFPVFSMLLPVLYKLVGITTITYVPWAPITLTNGGLVHLTFAAILGVASYTRGMEKIETIRSGT